MTYKNFKDVALALGYTPKTQEPKPEKEIKCKKCGGVMIHTPGTNVVTCTGIYKDKDGSEKPCKNFILWH